MGHAPEEGKWSAQMVWPQRRVVGRTRKAEGGQRGQKKRGKRSVG